MHDLLVSQYSFLLLYKVHRLDRDCSGVLVLGRTQLSASIMHAIFREKTADALGDVSY